MSVTQINVGSPTNEILYQDTNIGATVDAIKGSSALVLWLTVDNTANGATTYLRLWNTAGGRVTNGTTVPDMVLPVFGSSIQTFVLQTSATSGITFGTALSAAASTTGGTSGNTAPSSAVKLTLAYV